MADKQINELTTASSLNDTDVFAIEQDSGGWFTFKATLLQLYAYIVSKLAVNNLTLPDASGAADGDLVTYDIGSGLATWAAPVPTPAPGADRQVTFNDAGALAGASKAGIGASGSFEMAVDAAPTVPATGKMAIFARAIASRNMPAFMGPNGLDSALQPFWGRNKIGFWSPIGNATTAVVGVGIVAPTLINASATSYNVAATSLLTSQRRLGNNSAATAGASGGFRQPTTQFFRSTTDPWGGFFLVIRFAEGTTVTDSRCFVGMYASTGAIGNVNPSTLLNTIGMSYDSGDSTWHITHNDGSGVATRIDLGSDYPCNQTTDGYELAVFAPPGQSSVWVQVTRLGTVHSTTLELTADLPASGVMLAPHINCNNGPTAAVKTIVLVTMYVETDY